MEKEKGTENWSEKVEDLVDAGDVESAISLLESVVETLNPSDSASQLPLASALSDLADLYSSKGFSLKADHLQSRASVLKQLHHSNSQYLSLSLICYHCFIISFPFLVTNLLIFNSFSDEQVPKESNEDGLVKPTASDGSVEKREEVTAQTSAAGGSSDEGTRCFSYWLRLHIDLAFDCVFK